MTDKIRSIYKRLRSAEGMRVVNRILMNSILLCIAAAVVCSFFLDAAYIAVTLAAVFSLLPSLAWCVHLHWQVMKGASGGMRIAYAVLLLFAAAWFAISVWNILVFLYHMLF